MPAAVPAAIVPAGALNRSRRDGSTRWQCGDVATAGNATVAIASLAAVLGNGLALRWVPGWHSHFR